MKLMIVMRISIKSQSEKSQFIIEKGKHTSIGILVAIEIRLTKSTNEP